MPDKLSGKSRTLSGFSFSAMVFAMGFFKDEPQASGPLVISLLTASVTFLMTAEIADFSLKYWEYFVAELLFLVASISLFGGFAWFISVKFSFFGWPPLVVAVLPVALYALMFGETVRTTWRLDRYEEAHRES